ncbi:tetratricopeptide repeat protein [Psychrobacillus sp. L4]|uniref:tetratricopeptide repeat protein n=1 Tax=Psychrobacillus sp. L4 TaxID=3236892 RepID=UPI0036F3A70D
MKKNANLRRNCLIILVLLSFIYILNENNVFATEKEKTFFAEQADTINRMKEYMNKNNYDVNHLLSLANLYENLFLYEDAEEVYNMALSKNPTNTEANFRLLNIYILQGNLHEAEIKGNSMIKKNMESAGLYESMALIYLIKKEFHLALNYANLALNINENEDNISYLNELIELIQRNTEIENKVTAETELIDFISYDTFKSELIKNMILNSENTSDIDFNIYYEFLAQSELKRNDLNESIKYFEKIIDNKDSLPQSLDALIISYTLNNDKKQLENLLTKYQSKLSKQQNSIINILGSYLESNDTSKLVALSSIIENNNYQQAYFYSYLTGQLYEKNNDLENSKEMYYRFLNNTNIKEIEDQNYWYVLQPNVIKSLGKIELKMN